MSDCCRPLFLWGTLALLGGGLLMPSVVSAQQLRFDQSKYRANPGDTVELRLLAEDAGAISGLNFALRVSAEDAEHVLIEEATSFSTQPGATFRYTDHRLRRSGIESGLVTGDAAELRGVLYSHRATPATINTAAGPRHVVSVFLPVALEASGRVFLELVNDSDEGIALLGMADGDGNAVEDVRGDMATIVIERVGVPQVTDFREPRFWPGWRFVSAWPLGTDPKPIGESLPGEGLNIRTTSFMSFGSWEYDFVNLGAWSTPAAGNLLVTDWEMSSTHSGADNPAIRLRHMTTNALDATEVIFQDLGEDPFGIDATPNPDGVVYRTITQVPQHAGDNTGFEGINPYLDLMGNGEYGQRPGQLRLRRMVEREFDPGLLRGRRTEYYQNFGTRDGGGWLFESGMGGGIEATFSRGRNGLGITSGGPMVEDPGAPFGVRFSTGAWFAHLDVIDTVADPNRWYRVEADFVMPIENPANSPMIRLHAAPHGNEAYFTAFHYAGIDLGDPHLDRADHEGRTMSLWFEVPEQWAGKHLSLSFDIYQLDGESAGPDANPSVFMRWVRLTSYEKPTLTPAPSP